jgi:hypothetical protein
MEKLESFINAILETRRVWLLEAKEGFFAMLEDNKGNSYIPLWESEEKALQNVGGDWAGYTTTYMGFSELAHWLKELADDDINIAVSPEREGEITALASIKLRKWVKQYDDHSYQEEDENEEDGEQEEDHTIETRFGPDDKAFDYGDGWAQPWS